MRRLALLVMSLVSVVALGLPQIADAEPQRARSRGGSPSAQAPTRSARPPQSRGPSRGISRRSPAAAPRTAPGGSSQRQVGRVRSGGSAGRSQGGVQKGRVTAGERPTGRSRVTAVRPAGPSSDERGATSRTTGQVRTRGREPAGAVTTVGSKPSRSRVVNVPPPGSSASPAQSAGPGTAPDGSRVRQRSPVVGSSSGRAGLGDRGGSRVSRRPPGDANVVGRAVPRRAPLASSPLYESNGRRQGGIAPGRHAGREAYRSGYRYEYGRSHVRPRGRRDIYVGGYGHRYYRHVHRPRFFYPAAYGSYFYFPGYSFGLGYWDHTYGYGYSGYAYYPYGYATYYSSGRSYADPYTGFLRLKVKPRDAEVYVDGYYVGVVNDFDGIAQRLRLEEGTHLVEIRHPAYLPLELEVLIVTGEKVTFEGYLEPR